MQTVLAPFIKDTPEGREADAILRACVHCGFCTAACPTYQLLGDELDGPRGRIYLIKQVLEGAPVSEKTQLHLDRCLTCRACETVCPSGVKYARLADIGRQIVAKQVPRSAFEKFKRWALRKSLLNATLFSFALKLGRIARPILPPELKKRIPPLIAAGRWPSVQHKKKILALNGCVQPLLRPSIDTALARILDKIGLSLITTPSSGCCGAVSHHLSAQEDAVAAMQRNIDAWWPYLHNKEAEAVVCSASGCTAMVKEYGHLLRHDPHYADKAALVAEAVKDPVEVVALLWPQIEPLLKVAPSRRLAFHSPCTLQHALKLSGKVESLLSKMGFTLTVIPEAHLCCGSAGTYSILQADLAKQLKTNKLSALQSDRPELIASANIGCITHLQTDTALPVCHWIELLDEQLKEF